MIIKNMIYIKKTWTGTFKGEILGGIVNGPNIGTKNWGKSNSLADSRFFNLAAVKTYNVLIINIHVVNLLLLIQKNTACR